MNPTLFLTSLAVIVIVFEPLFTPELFAATRKWTARSQKNTVEAELVRTDGESVTLKKTDGKEIRVALKSLSNADQLFVGKQGLSPQLQSLVDRAIDEQDQNLAQLQAELESARKDLQRRQARKERRGIRELKREVTSSEAFVKRVAAGTDIIFPRLDVETAAVDDVGQLGQQPLAKDYTIELYVHEIQTDQIIVSVGKVVKDTTGGQTNEIVRELVVRGVDSTGLREHGRFLPSGVFQATEMIEVQLRGRPQSVLVLEPLDTSPITELFDTIKARSATTTSAK